LEGKVVTSLIRRAVASAGEFLYNARFARYEYANDLRDVPASKLLAVIERREQDALGTMTRLSQALNAGDIGVADWRNGVATELRRVHSQAYALGRGGWQQMSAEDRAAVSERLKKEFTYLRQFSKDIADGKLSDAQIKARVQLYVNHVNATYYQGETAAKIDAGFTQEIRDLGATDMHCTDCPGYADHWEPIGSLPEPGDDCECRGNCLCSKRYK
jgi:hypothetical protein